MRIIKITVLENDREVTVDVTRAIGIPTGGTTAQVLKKSSDTNYDVEWADEGGGIIPPGDIFHGGFVDYNDLATATTPIPFIADTEITLTNDGLGAFTNKTYLPTGVTDIWNTTTNKFDFTQLKLGDMIDIRVDLNITTASNNQTITVNMHLAEGASEYTIPFTSQYEYKTAGTRQVVTYNGIYMGDNNTLNNPAELHLLSDKTGSVVVNGWFCKIIRKG